MQQSTRGSKGESEKNKLTGRTGAEDLTEELCGVSVACSFFIVGKSLIDDLAHSSIQTL